MIIKPEKRKKNKIKYNKNQPNVELSIVLFRNVKNRYGVKMYTEIAFCNDTLTFSIQSKSVF